MGELSLTGKRWIWPAVRPTMATLGAPSGALPRGVPGWLGTLLHGRGLRDVASVEAYLGPSLAHLDDPAQMADMHKAVTRVMQAIESHEPITIYGDYDVDGVCSSALLVQFLRRVGAAVDFYIPDRRAEGYGLNGAAVRAIASRSTVMITTDCGITAHAEIAVARQLGCDVVVIDHHRVQETLPPAVACLNPQRDDCPYPFKGLCAAGVAFMFAAALRRALRDGGRFPAGGCEEPDLRDFLDLVGVATVADVVPLHGANRVLVAAGLRRLATTQRKGLIALCAVAKVDRTAATATDLGFRIGPRINARGRLSHAGEAVELMLTDDDARAKALAESLDAANRERRDLEAATVEEAIGLAETNNLVEEPGLVVHHPSWHPGVLGLVASRLAARYHRPAVVIGEGGKGSGRSIDGLDLHACIAAGADFLIRFGGHRAAAGVTIEEAQVEAFRRRFCDAVRQQIGDPPYVPCLRPELEVGEDMLTLETVSQLERLAPFGEGNREPLLIARNVRVADRRVVGERHLKLRVGRGSFDAIAFGMAELGDRVSRCVDLAFHLERNVYGGRENVQLRVADLRAATADGDD